MTVDHWRRDEPTFYNFLALDKKSLSAPDPIGGLQGALMSKDTQSDSQTYTVNIPPGWKSQTDAQYGSLEFFILLISSSKFCFLILYFVISSI